MKSIKSAKKTFVLDTNVILHDSTCINQFKEHDIVIPITVIEELDHFKRGSQVINLNAREFARTLDSLTGSALFNGGVPLGKGRGKVSIALSRGLSDEIREIFKEDTPDHRILSAALDIKKKKNNDSVVLISKDVNLRMKAKAVGVQAEDYTTDKITNV
ncbi:MAG TPA: PIN domain-containing protein, partial [Ignavibacteria bacterium]|nr:PIN domain-containing protein [Ignavibacteria bacterium]